MANTKLSKEIHKAFKLKANKLLVGCRIVNVRHANEEETNAMGLYESPLVLGLRNKKDDYSEVVVMQDAEGNGAGALMVFTPDNKVNVFSGI